MTPAEFEAEIARLNAEVERLRVQNVATLSQTMTAGVRPSAMTVAGAEEMILQVNPDDTVGFLNPPMGRLLGINDRRAAIGNPLAPFDEGPLGAGILSGLAQIARRAEGPQVLVRVVVGFPREQLPESLGARPPGDPTLRFVVSAIKGRVQIVAQDVSRLSWIEGLFSRYVPPAVIERMQATPERDFLRMDRRRITVLFGDLRGFTALSQTLPPEEVHEVVSSFLANMVECVERLEGTVDKFIGDEVMALFGAPLEQPDHALRALVCAAEMQSAHGRWIRERSERTKPALPLGIGVATGDVVIGNIGTAARMEYSALGHTVNLAARLCGAAVAGEILTVATTHADAHAALPRYSGLVAVPRFGFSVKGRMTFKNVADPVDVVAVETRAAP